MNAEAVVAAAIAAARNASAEATAGREYMTPQLAELAVTMTNNGVEAYESLARAAGYDPNTLVYWASGSHEWKPYNVTPDVWSDDRLTAPTPARFDYWTDAPEAPAADIDNI